MYLSALNRFIHTCFKQKSLCISRFSQKIRFFGPIPYNVVQKCVFSEKISKYINFLFRTSMDKSIQRTQIHMLPYKKIKILKKKIFAFIKKIKKIIGLSRGKDINLQQKYFKGFLLDPFRNFCGMSGHDLRKKFNPP